MSIYDTSAYKYILLRLSFQVKTVPPALNHKFNALRNPWSRTCIRLPPQRPPFSRGRCYHVHSLECNTSIGRCWSLWGFHSRIIFSIRCSLRMQKIHPWSFIYSHSSGPLLRIRGTQQNFWRSLAKKFVLKLLILRFSWCGDSMATFSPSFL